MPGIWSWANAARVIVIVAGILAVTTIVAISLDPDAYFYYCDADRSTWRHPTEGVVITAVFTVIETGIAYLVLGVRRGGRVWMRALLALLLLVPWGGFLLQGVVHAPVFYMLHILWIWVLIGCMAVAVVVSGAAHGYAIFLRGWRVGAEEPG